MNAAAIAILALASTAPAQADTIEFRNPVALVVQNRDVQCANAALVMQLADAATTRVILRNGGYERDPLARGAVRSDVGAFALAFVLNYAVRILIPHQACNVALVETLAVANNLGDLRK